MDRLLSALVFLRPFICSIAFTCLNAAFSLLFLAFLAAWIFYKGLPRKEIGLFRYPLMLFLLALTISLIYSRNKLNSLEELYKYASGLLLLIIAGSLSERAKEGLVKTIVWAGLIVSLWVIYQYYFGFRHMLNYLLKTGISSPFALDYIARRRVFSPFVTPSVLAGYLIMILPLLLVKKKTAWLIIPLSYSLWLTKSLGAVLSILTAIFLFFALEKKWDKRRYIFLFSLGILAVFLFIVRSTALKQHTWPIFSGQMRLEYWRDTIRIISQHPLTGVGLGNFNLIRSRYAHNSYLQLWAETGILGLVAILWLVFRRLKRAIYRIKNPPYPKETACLLISVFAFLFHNLFEFTFFLPEVVLIWWVLLGVVGKPD